MIENAAPKFVCTGGGSHPRRTLRFRQERRPNPLHGWHPGEDEFEGWQAIVELDDGSEVDAAVVMDVNHIGRPTRDRWRVLCPKCGTPYVLRRDPMEIWSAAMRLGVLRIDLSRML